MNYIGAAAAPLEIAATTRHQTAAGKTAPDTDSLDMVVEKAVDTDCPGMAADNFGYFDTLDRNYFVRPAPDNNFAGYFERMEHYYLTADSAEPAASA